MQIAIYGHSRFESSQNALAILRALEHNCTPVQAISLFIRVIRRLNNVEIASIPWPFLWSVTLSNAREV